ncbi:Sensor protein kinase WalK (Fragment) [Seminavis robusta]|uniref:histidine kinase n=1 Tax=Seminavis robusta TaxID=568900 RepID=A0A9N8HBQ5_9STRA
MLGNSFRSRRINTGASLRSDSEDNQEDVASAMKKEHASPACMRIRGLFNYLSVHRTSLLVSGLVFLVVMAAGLLTAELYLSQWEQDDFRDAQDLANETADYFVNALEYKAMMPLFSLAQFATEIPLFRDLPDLIGPSLGNNSLPFIPPAPGQELSHRNLTGSPCSDPTNIQRYNEIASTIKANAKMPRVLLQLYFHPQAVVCFVHPRVYTHPERPDVIMNATAQLGLDMLQDVKLRYHAEKTLRSDNLVIAGPITLRHCIDHGSCHNAVKKAIVLRLAVPMPGRPIVLPTTGEEVDRWGMVVATIDWLQVVKESGMYQRFHSSGREFLLTRNERLYGTEAESTALARSPGFQNVAAPTYRTVALTVATDISEWHITVQYPSRQSSIRAWMIPCVILLSLVVTGLVFTVLVQKQDMLAQTRIQEARVETERKMTAYFAHELRNPLSAIESALLVMPFDDPVEIKELTQGMKSCTGFMGRILNNLCDVRQLEEGKMEFYSCPFELNQVIMETHSMLAPKVPKGVDFKYVVDVDPNKNTVSGDFHRILQVLNNVTSNALKYCLSGSVVLSVCWDEESGRVRFECKDTGPGIPIEDQAHLFERFVRRGGAPGSGLGLCICKQIVDALEGDIYFESDPRVKQGTTCVILLPLVSCTSTSVATQSKGTEHAPPIIEPEMIEEEISILLVDDIMMNRLMLTKRLRKGVMPNAKIIEAATGEAAVELVESGDHQFQLVIVDQYMESAGGVMLGTDTVIALRRMGLKCMIIGCSGNDIEKEFEAAGADGCWSKPMPSNSVMLQEIREGLDLSARTQTTS